jgi:hypothetical protein
MDGAGKRSYRMTESIANIKTALVCTGLGVCLTNRFIGILFLSLWVGRVMVLFCPKKVPPVPLVEKRSSM